MSEELTISVEVNNNRLDIIKSLRYATGNGISSCIGKLDDILMNGNTKIFIDRIDKQEKINHLLEVGFIIREYPTPIPTPTSPNNSNGDEIFVYRKKEPHNHNYISCIKTVRHASGYGLREAKAVVDDMFSYDRPVPIPLHEGHEKQHCIDYLVEHGFLVTGYVRECFKGEDDLFKI